MREATNNNGGIMQRFIPAIIAFKVKFGYWPIKMKAYVGAMATLATWHLTPFEFPKEKLVKVRTELGALQGAYCGR